MRLFLYYSFCSAKNQIKKLFHSWVAVFLLVCLLFGLAIGFGGALLADLIGGDGQDSPALPEEPAAPGADPPFWTPERTLAVVELAAAGVVLLVLLFHILLADKSGSSIFLMADVNLLFASPLKPQSVLLFRLLSQIFGTLFASVYLAFQLPNLVLNLGLSTPTAVALIVAWVFTLVYGKLFSVLLYTLASTHPRVKKFLRPVVYAAVLLLAGGFYLYTRAHAGQGLLEAACGFFNPSATRWIPVYGWLKGLAPWVAEGAWPQAAGTLLLLAATAAVLVYVIWHIRADFYEDAMAKSQETAEAAAAAQSGETARRKKDRGDRLRRDGLRHGRGAVMFFCKTLYNRFRFAPLRVFTKTTVLYLGVSAGVSLLTARGGGGAGFLGVGLVLCGLVFFRALGNPIGEDMGRPYFALVPANPWAKVIWSLLGGTVCCALDLLPALLLGALLTQAPASMVLGCFLLALGLDFYISNVMLFLNLSLPSSIAPQLRASISMMLFFLLAMLPLIPVVLVGVLTQFHLSLLLATAGLGFAALGGVFFSFTPLFLLRGQN